MVVVLAASVAGAAVVGTSVTGAPVDMVGIVVTGVVVSTAALVVRTTATAYPSGGAALAYWFARFVLFVGAVNARML